MTETKETTYTTFDARVVQELEQREEFGLCDGSCVGAIAEIAGGTLGAIFGGPGGGALGGGFIADGIDSLGNGACS
jgi:hypothetical protein